MVEALNRSSKKAKTETEIEASATPRPLTEENLRLLQGLPVMPPKKSKQSEDNAGSISTKASIATRELLRINALMMDDTEALMRWPRIQEVCDEIVSEGRMTPMNREEQNAILAGFPFMSSVNEDTFIDLLWPALIRDKRHIKGSGMYDDKIPILTGWSKDQLARLRNNLFEPDTIPVLDPGSNRILKELLDSVPKITTPKPDYCYGFLSDAFSSAEQEVNALHRQFAMVSKPLYHCFFAVEFKTLEGDFGVCRTQCCRAGAALVRATEGLLKLAAPSGEHPLQQDHHQKTPCMAFTLAVSPVVSELYVHWAEPSGNNTIYHMNKARGYYMERGEELCSLRHDVDNVLDWGCLQRLTSIRSTLAQIKAKRDLILPSPLSIPSEGRMKRRAEDDLEESALDGEAPVA